MKEELLNELKLYFGDDYDAKQANFVLSLIDAAIDEVVSAMYPFNISDESLELAREKALKRYKHKVKAIVQYHYDKQGKEGVISWSENNTSAMYENAGTPKSYFAGIIPQTRII